MAADRPTQSPTPHGSSGRRRSRRRSIAALLVGASIIAFVTTPLGSVVVYVSTQLAGPLADGSLAADTALALPPPEAGYSHGAAGSGANGFGGSIAPSATSQSWPGTGPGSNGGAFAFVGAHHGSLWGVPPGDNNSRGVGYCVMEDVAGSGTVTLLPDSALWDASEMARAGALLSTFGGDRVVPYGIDDSGHYNLATGEWELPQLLGGGEYTRRRHVAVNFGARMFLEDLSANALPGGRKLARDTAVVDGTGGEFAALRNGYQVAQHMADVADAQSAMGGLTLALEWGTANGLAPTTPGTYPLQVIVADATGRRVGMVPVLQLSDIGIGTNRSSGVVARVDNSVDSADDMARWNAATATGWPVWNMVGLLATDPRFVVHQNMMTADVADRSGVARFDVTITSARWELAFHAQAPTDDVALYAGTGIQGQVTWAGPPQSASVHVESAPPDLGRFQIRKALDDAGVQGTRGMSGFVFDVTRVEAPGNSGGRLGSFTTDAAGRTPVIEAPPGGYHVTEIGRPAWAAGLVDTGPNTFQLVGGPDPDGIPLVEFVYTNRVPAASITTAAVDRSDGDRYVTLDDPAGESNAGSDGATAGVIDAVASCGLVPGTEYRLMGTIQIVADGTATPSGVSASTTFVPTEPCGTTEVAFEVPPDSPLAGGAGVVFETLVVAATGQVVAEHADPTSVAQTIHFPEITTEMQRVTLGQDQRSIEPGDEVVDVVTYNGLAPGLGYRAELTLYERLDDGTCVSTGLTSFEDFTTPASSSPSTGQPPQNSIVVGPMNVNEPGVFVGFERIARLDGLEDGTSVLPTVVASHEDCDELSQTIHVVAPPPPPPLQTPPPTTASTTTTTTPTITTPPAEVLTTTTLVAAIPVTIAPPPPNPPPPRPLPRTGSTSVVIVVAAATLAALGAGVRAISRRR